MKAKYLIILHLCCCRENSFKKKIEIYHILKSFSQGLHSCRENSFKKKIEMINTFKLQPIKFSCCRENSFKKKIEIGFEIIPCFFYCGCRENSFKKKIEIKGCNFPLTIAIFVAEKIASKRRLKS